MKAFHPFVRPVLLTFLLAIAHQQVIGRSVSDLAAPPKRRSTVEAAQALSRVPAVALTHVQVPNPFNPPGFAVAESPGSASPSATAVRAESVIRSDREILELLVHRFPAGGAMRWGGKILLTAGDKRYEAGQVLILSYDGRDAEVEIVAVTTTSFTLRYGNAELSRPIRIAR